MAKKIQMVSTNDVSFTEVYERFITAKTALGVSDATIRNYRWHLQSISKHLDITASFEDITRETLDEMVVSMRNSGLAHNTVCTYVRVIKTFYNWACDEGISDIRLKGIKERDAVKNTYTDGDLELLLQKPKKNCSFCEYRNWVIVNFLVNSGCRAATIRNIQNQDVDLTRKQVIFRHNKNGKIQSIPLCTYMCNILQDYMKIRRGKATDYLFCDQYGGMFTESGLRYAIIRYNKSRGVQKTSIHLFRHTFARKYLVDCGGNAFTLQRLLGHSTLDMTKHYCNIFDADIAKNYDSFSPLSQLKSNSERIKMKK